MDGHDGEWGGTESGEGQRVAKEVSSCAEEDRKEERRERKSGG